MDNYLDNAFMVVAVAILEVWFKPITQQLKQKYFAKPLLKRYRCSGNRRGLFYPHFRR